MPCHRGPTEGQKCYLRRWCLPAHTHSRRLSHAIALAAVVCKRHAGRFDVARALGLLSGIEDNWNLKHMRSLAHTQTFGLGNGDRNLVSPLRPPASKKVSSINSYIEVVHNSQRLREEQAWSN